MITALPWYFQIFDEPQILGRVSFVNIHNDKSKCARWGREWKATCTQIANSFWEGVYDVWLGEVIRGAVIHAFVGRVLYLHL